MVIDLVILNWDQDRLSGVADRGISGQTHWAAEQLVRFRKRKGGS